MAKEMGLDRAPIEFRKLVFLVPPIVQTISIHALLSSRKGDSVRVATKQFF